MTREQGKDNQAAEAPTEARNPDGGRSRTPKVEWDDSRMQTTYANVVNAASTREEVSLFFGTNQTWNIGDSRELTVQLAQRIILSPFAAKRLHLLLGTIIKQYEDRFGSLTLEGQDRNAEQVLRGGDT